MGDVPAVLRDHAHCEMKAASTALSLCARAEPYPNIVRGLTELAEEELRHFRRVLDELVRRNIPLGHPDEDRYAAELRRRAMASARDHSRAMGLADRFLIGALIEARSCERFKLLATALRAQGDEALATFYEDLLAAEARHYRTFIDFAEEVVGARDTIQRRLAELSQIESDINDGLGSEPTIHG